MKSIFYISALLLLSTAAVAQKEGNLNNRFGIKVGDNNSVLSTSLNKSSGSKEGLCLGGYYQLRLKHNMALLLELSFNQLRCMNSGKVQFIVSSNQGDIVQQRTTLYLDYLSLPLTYKLYTGKAFNFQLGAYGAFLLNANQKGTLSTTTLYTNNYATFLGTQTQSENRNATSSVYRADAGLSGGIGYDFPFGLNFTLKYFESLVNIDQSFKTLTGKPLHNQYIQFTAGYSFGCKN